MNVSRFTSTSVVAMGLLGIALEPACTTDELVGVLPTPANDAGRDAPVANEASPPPVTAEGGVAKADGSESGGADECESPGGTLLAREATSGNFALAVDATHLYWSYVPIASATGDCLAAECQGAVREIEKSGGSVVTLAAGEPNLEPFAIPLAYAAGNVYWAILGTIDGNSSPVRWVSAAGGTPANFSPPTPYMFAFTGLVADDANLFWGGTNGGLLSEPLGGGVLTNLGASGIGALDVAVDSDNLYWVGGFATETDDSGLWYVPKAGGTPSLVASFSTTGPLSYVATSSGITWSTSAGEIWHATTVTSTPIQLASKAVGAVFAVDDSSVYWTAQTSAILKEPLDGGTITTVASHQGLSTSHEFGPVAVAVDDANVYWANQCGVIAKAPK
jgi:hypothetical protein